MNEVFARLSSESPTFFKRLQLVSLIIFAVAGIILWLSTNGVFDFPDWVDKLVVGIMSSGLGSYVAGKTAVKDPAKLKEKMEGDAPKN